MEIAAEQSRAVLIDELSDPTVLLQRMVDGLVSLVPNADGAAVELLDAGNLLYYATAGGYLAGSVGTRVALHHSLSGSALRSGSVLRCDDTDTDPGVDRLTCRRLGIRSMICVPLMRPAGAFGVVKLAARRPGAFSSADVTICEAVSGTLAVLIAAQAALAASTGKWTSDPRDGGDGSQRGEVDALSSFVSELIRPGTREVQQSRRRIEQVLADHAFTVVCQLIVVLRSATVVGVEGLARFPGPPARPPDHWFAEAHHVGLGDELELAAVSGALELFDQLPRELVLTVNVSPSTVTNPALVDLILAHHPTRTVVELTEHLRVDDYARLRGTLATLRRRGVKLSIDDTGAGFASFSHIVKLSPECIKLDRELVSGIDIDPVRQALGHALVAFAHATGATVIAEGIETAAELDAVSALGFDYGQGFHLGRPGPLPGALDISRSMTPA